MDKKISLFALVFAFMCMMVPQGVLGWGPNTHMFICNEALADPALQNSYIADTIKANRQCFDAGFQMTDITVIYYYTEGKKYESTHSWGFQRAMMEDATDDCERAFAYGIAAHLIQDSVAHNNFVPNKIRETAIPNWFIHPIEEGKIEAHIIANNPDVFARTQKSLDWLWGRPEFMDKIQNEIYSSRGVVLDVKKDVGFLRDALASPGGFYSQVFHLPDVYNTVSKGDFTWGMVFLIVTGVFTAIFIFRYRKMRLLPFMAIFGVIAWFLLAGGLSGITSVGDAQFWMDKSVERTVWVYQSVNWEQRDSYDATGFTALANADANIMLIDIAALAAILAVMFIVIWFRRKK